MTPQLDWLLWRGVFWCSLSYLIVSLLAGARRDRRLLSLGAIAVAQQLTVLTNIPAQDFRYMAGLIPIGIILVPVLLARKRTGSPVPGHG